MHTVYTYILYARECVRIYSGFSKRIPRLERPRVVCIFPTELRKIYLRVGDLDHGHAAKM